MPEDVQHIRGDTFTVAGQFLGGSYTNWSGASQVRDESTDELLTDLDFDWVDATVGSFVVTGLNTNNWPINKYVVFDVQVTSPTGVTKSSELIRIRVMRDSTRA